MVALAKSPSEMKWVMDQISRSDGLIPFSSRKDSVTLQSSPPAANSSGGARISPTVLFVIVILAVIFFISGLLHLLIRFLSKRGHRSRGGTSNSTSHPDGRYSPSSEAIQRQLQQLFHLHDSGLDQAFIDALPIFLYRELVGPKEPFDCAVCLCEFADDDKLRLLPVCSHAFHLACIDAWLLSNSTCPLCRGSLFLPGLAMENPAFDFDDGRDEEGAVGMDRDDGQKKPMDLETGEEKMVFPVRLGKFRSLQSNDDKNNRSEGVGESITHNSSIIDSNNAIIASKALGREEGESSSSSLDARRCYSMGSYQYVVGDSVLQVALSSVGRNGDGRGSRRRRVVLGESAAAIDEGGGRRLCVAGRGESFSVSKIWQWSNKKGKHPMMPSFDAASLDGGFPWIGGGDGGGNS